MSCSSCSTTRHASANSPPARHTGLNLLRGIGTGIVAAITIFVLSYLAVLEGPNVVDGTLALVPPHRAERIRRVTRDCAKTVTGYISGNLLIRPLDGPGSENSGSVRSRNEG